MTSDHVSLSRSQVETVAGLSAGSLSTLAVHPLDVVKTRLQIHRSLQSQQIGSLSLLRSLTKGTAPFHLLYRGLGPNLFGNATSWALFFYFKSRFDSIICSFQNGRRKGTDYSLRSTDYFLSSFLSGVMTTACTNPIWVLKTRLLSSDKGSVGAYNSSLHGVRMIWKQEGVRGFYRGVGISMVGTLHGAVQFAVYEPLKKSWQKQFSVPESSATTASRGQNNKLSHVGTLTTSGAAKIVAGMVTYPYQVVRSRLQTYDAQTQYGRGIVEVVKGVWREGGLRGFYRGAGVNVIRVLPATWVTFLVYENVRWALSSSGA